MSTTHLVIFAKAPVAGEVKTRLIAALGAAGAAQLARRFLNDALTHACAAGVDAVELCASPDFADPAWADYALPPGVAIGAQGEGDLGARMARAARRHLAEAERVLLIGTDCPALSGRRLRAAARVLDDYDAVIYPALDGGYVLLGLRAYASSLFSDIPWSTAEVAALTRARMRDLGLRVWVGDMLRDIDEPSDLARLPGRLRQAIARSAPWDLA